MSQTEPPIDGETPTSRAPADDTSARTLKAFGKLIDRITPWLLDLGSWFFGALIAFSLVILGALFTIGPVDPAVLVSTAAFALALPIDVAGFFLLRLAADMKTVALEDVAMQAFLEVGFRVDKQAMAREESAEKRAARVVLRYSYGLLALAICLTLVGIGAVLWHMAWWIAVVFVVMVALSQGLVGRAMAATGSTAVWRSPAGAVEPSRKQSARKPK